MQRSRRQGLGVWLLFYQIFVVIGFRNIPLATLIITGLQVLIFLRIIPVPWYNPADVCISVDSVWHRKEWIRMLYGALEHGNDCHLYCNMISFVWKGIFLERRFGTARFAYLVSVFTVLCSATLVALYQAAGDIAGRAYHHRCVVGFSAVLYALKMLTMHYWPRSSANVMGIPLDILIRCLMCVELLVGLLLSQILVPKSSSLGHLAGLLVGIAYIHTPIGYVIDSGWKVIESVAFATP